jgi:PAS domain S-box-containing protein
MKNEELKNQAVSPAPTLFNEGYADKIREEMTCLIRDVFGRDVEIGQQPSWQYLKPDYLFNGLLINRQIAFFYVRGQVKSRDCEEVYQRMQKLIGTSGDRKLYYIMDLSNIASFSLPARKAYSDINDKLQQHWTHSYYIFSALGNTIFKLYTAIRPVYSQQATLADDVAHALRLCRQRVVKKKEEQKASLLPEEMTREELLEAYRQLKEEKNQMEVAYRARADEMISIMSRITWEEDFSPDQNALEQDDPFFNVFSSFALIKEDLRSIYEQQKQANQVLEEEVARQTWRFSSVIENTSEMIMSVDEQWQVKVVNTAFREHFRKAQKTDIREGDQLLSLYDDESRAFWQGRFERAFRGESFREELSGAMEGQTYHYEIDYNPIRHAGEKKVSEVSVFARDITALRHAKDEAYENALNLTRALTIARAGSWELDLLSGNLIIGKEGLQVLGLPDQEELRLNMQQFTGQFLHPDDVGLVQDRMQYAASQIDNPDFGDRFSYRLIHQDGQVLHMMLYSQFKTGKKGVIYGITQDITPQVEVQEKLLAQNQSLRKVNSELDSFVYSVSHDLRAPLASVLGLINIARSEQDIEKHVHYLNLQEKSIRRLDHFIREIIDLSKNARLEVNNYPIDWKALVEELFDAQTYDTAAEGVEKRVSILAPREFRSDYRRLHVILNNLITNSIRYADFRKDQPYVAVDIRVDEKQARISVADNGQGIAEAHLPNIFKMFYRANEFKAGSGLGLYIVQETLEKLNGSIQVDSCPGKGTEFTIHLPNPT